MEVCLLNNETKTTTHLYLYVSQLKRQFLLIVPIPTCTAVQTVFHGSKAKSRSISVKTVEFFRQILLRKRQKLHGLESDEN